jgi:hypothetical protein
VDIAREKALASGTKDKPWRKKSKRISEEIFQRQALGKDRLSF